MWGKGGKETHGEGAELARPALAPDGEDLRHLARDAEGPGAGLEVPQHLHIHGRLAKQRARRARQPRHEHGREARPPRELQHQHGNHDVLHQDERRLAVGAEREAVAEVVRQADEVRRRLEQVRQERDALGGARGRELEDLRDLDDGGGGDDAEA